MKTKTITAAAAAALLSISCNMQNPLLSESGLPYGAPQFDKISEEDYLPAFKQAIADGADEIDYVVNLVKLKSGDLDYVEREMREIVTVCNEAGKISKVIFENCYLTDDEKRTLCRIALKVRPTFIKTSTGFGTPAAGKAVGATVEDVRLMKAEVGDAIKVKAAGGVRTLADALAMIEAGAERIGTSAGVKIVEELKASL